jgi:hypothetical protein
VDCPFLQYVLYNKKITCPSVKIKRPKLDIGRLCFEYQ